MPRACTLAVILLAAATQLRAQAPVEPPPYQRLRSGAGDWRVRGANQNWPGGYGGIPGFVSPFFAPPIVAGSWYERPYPYHFDYYRHRWGGSPYAQGVDPGVEMIPAADCPCLAP